MALDLVIRNSIVVDGSGMPRYRTDVGAVGGRIVEIGRIRAAAERTIDTDGLIVAPGFIDGHAHMDATEGAMNTSLQSAIWAVAALLSLGFSSGLNAQQAQMSFFVTSAGVGKGADLGGLAGADRHCQQLAQAAGAGSRTWHAYLAAQEGGGQPAVNARDRIGKGPWQNAKGVVVAKTVDELHSANNLTKQTALSEKGEVVNGYGDKPNRHDALTGAKPDGTAFPVGEDRTCKNWTSSTQGTAMLGHIDRQGLRDDDASHSWNSSHPSRGPDGGCSQTDLRSTGGDGLFYCFAAN